MRKLKKITLLVVFILSISLVNIHAGEIKKTFKNIKEVKFKGMSSDCVVKGVKGNEVTVYLEYTSHNDYFKPQIKEDNGTLILKDSMAEKNAYGQLPYRQRPLLSCHPFPGIFPSKA